MTRLGPAGLEWARHGVARLGKDLIEQTRLGKAVQGNVRRGMDFIEHLRCGTEWQGKLRSGVVRHGFYKSHLVGLGGA